MIAGRITGGDGSTKRKRSTRSIYSINSKAVPTEQIGTQISAADKGAIITHYEDALVVKALIHNCMVHSILVDTGSSVNLLTLKVFDKMGLDQVKLSPVNTPLVGLVGKSTTIVGSIKLEVKLGEGNITKALQAKFMVVDIPFTYNAIIG